MNKFIILFLLVILAGCANKAQPVLNNIEVRTVQVTKPAPIVPQTDQLSLKPVEWIIVTPDNVDSVFEKIKKSGSEPVMFALSVKGYENISMNINDIRSFLQQQQQTIAIYKKQFNK